MRILFRERKFAKQYDQYALLVRTQGQRRARLIVERLNALQASGSLEDMRGAAGRLHELKGNRKGQLSLDLDHPYRLILVPVHDPVPCTEDGGMDWSEITDIEILGVEDTHE